YSSLTSLPTRRSSDLMRPWPRIECARLVEEASDALQKSILEDHRPSELAVRLHAALEREFDFELEVLGGGRTRSLRLESVYTRVMSISGRPLTDDYHFGQTIVNDFGRPFAQGANLTTDRKSTRLNSSHGSISYAVF